MSNSLSHLLGEPTAINEPLSLPQGFCLESGIFGGLVLGVATDAVMNKSRMPIRVLHLNLCALALPDVPLEVEATSLRKGRHTESLSYGSYNRVMWSRTGSAFCGNTPHSADEISLAMPTLPELGCAACA